jgi:hypothetical protein
LHEERRRSGGAQVLELLKIKRKSEFQISIFSDIMIDMVLRLFSQLPNLSIPFEIAVNIYESGEQLKRSRLVFFLVL